MGTRSGLEPLLFLLTLNNFASSLESWWIKVIQLAAGFCLTTGLFKAYAFQWINIQNLEDLEHLAAIFQADGKTTTGVKRLKDTWVKIHVTGVISLNSLSISLKNSALTQVKFCRCILPRNSEAILAKQYSKVNSHLKIDTLAPLPFPALPTHLGGFQAPSCFTSRVGMLE